MNMPEMPFGTKPMQPARVAHKAFPEIPGTVQEVQPGVESGTFRARVSWPVGAPVELTGNEWHPVANLEPYAEPDAEEYPVCPNCGNRHPVPTPEEAIAIAREAVVLQAFTMIRAEHGKYPEFERAFAIMQAAQRELAVRQFAVQLDTEFPTAEEGDRG